MKMKTNRYKSPYIFTTEIRTENGFAASTENFDPYDDEEIDAGWV